VPHGWRATFLWIMNEKHRADRHVIDLLLAHAPRDKTEAAYNRAVHLPRRESWFRNGPICCCRTRRRQATWSMVDVVETR
jgi:hypothetical protein